MGDKREPTFTGSKGNEAQYNDLLARIQILEGEGIPDGGSGDSYTLYEHESSSNASLLASIPPDVFTNRVFVTYSFKLDSFAANSGYRASVKFDSGPTDLEVTEFSSSVDSSWDNATEYSFSFHWAQSTPFKLGRMLFRCYNIEGVAQALLDVKLKVSVLDN